jgi:hypothetical protein
LDSRLDLAREFISHSVPVFIAKPVPLNWTGRTEFFYPDDWPYLDANEKHLEGWKPNYAVCAVTGIEFDVLDIDPRNGGDLIEQVLRTNGMMPPPRGAVATPRGGRHYYIKRTHFRKHTPWEGVDLQAGHDGGHGRGFVFIPPTRRKGKLYELTQALDWDALRATESSEEYAKFYRYLYSRYDFTKSELHHQDTGRYTLNLSEVDREDLHDRLQEIAQNIRYAEVGTRDNALNKYCFTMGGLVVGSALDEQYAIRLIEKATSYWDITQSERDHWVTPKILRGIEQGKQFPILCGF